MTSIEQFFTTCPKGFEEILQAELTDIGVKDTKLTVGGVHFGGDLETALRVCLWSRLANKVLLPIANFPVANAEALYEGVYAIPWRDHLRPDGSMLVEFIGTNKEINNSHFGALKVKDAIVDSYTQLGIPRPNIDKVKPEVRVHVRLHKSRANISIDLSGESLHRRGYRLQGGSAPLKENLAAALLMRANWPAIAADGGALLDPMCGSGTFLIEAAMMAADIAPGLLRGQRVFSGWLGNDKNLWQRLLDEAKERKVLGLAKGLPEIRGYDATPKAISIANENIERAGLMRSVRVTRRDLAQFAVPTHTEIIPGLVITNPPYGERLSEVNAMMHLYQRLGDQLRECFQGWQVGVFTANPELAKSMRLVSHKQYAFYNGAIPAKLFLVSMDERQRKRDKTVEENLKTGEAGGEPRRTVPLTDGAQMFANRLKKNKKKIAKWLKRSKVSCYRLYDADMPEYAVAIDVYEDENAAEWVHVQEYVPPKSVDEKRAEARLKEVISAIPSVLDVDPAKIIIKQRGRKRGAEQYVKLDNRKEFIEVTEGDSKLLVNLWDYLDTGLFLDHRPVRQMIAGMAKGKNFLNLFCYTGAATIHAANGGARRSTSIDMSNSYIDWAKQNLAVNGLGEGLHRMIVDDCFQWLEKCKETFELILLDPPTFSNSKKMSNTLDIQRDHVALIQKTMKCLASDGTLIFSNNFQQFKLDEESLAEYDVQDITTQTLDEDFQRNKKLHRCWLIRHSAI